jgi:KTSC domain
MHRLPLESTMLTSAAYRSDQTLDLEFRDGSRYRFFDVPAACFQHLLASDSKGAYFNRHIRNCFRYQVLAEIEGQN